MGFDIEEAMEKRKVRREEKLTTKHVFDVGLVRVDGGSLRVFDVEAVGLDDAVTKALLETRLEEGDIVREECRAKDVKTGKVLSFEDIAR